MNAVMMTKVLAIGRCLYATNLFLLLTGNSEMLCYTYIERSVRAEFP